MSHPYPPADGAHPDPATAPLWPVTAPPTYPAIVPRRRNRTGLLIGVVVAVLIVAVVACVGGLYLGNVGPLRDSGLAACEQLRDARTATPAPSGDGRISEADYLALRRRFADSRYDDIRTAGTAFVDLVWQLNGVSGGAALGALLLVGGQIVQAYSSLSGACANHGVVIPPLAQK